MNQNKLNLTQALVVEGKYDAARLAPCGCHHPDNRRFCYL